MMEHVVDIGGRRGPPPPSDGPEGPRALPATPVPGAVGAPPAREGLDHPRAVVGGVDYAVGGWGEYEINRRRARWDADRTARGAREHYEGRTYIGAGDAVRSVLAGSRAVVGGGRGRALTALQRAALNLSDALGRLEDRLCDPDDEGVWECAPAASLRQGRAGARFLTVPPVTSADLRAFAEDPSQETDPEAIYDLSEDVTSLVAAAGTDLPPLPPLADRASLPPLPSRVVPVSDDEGVLRLEAAAAPYISSLEALQAALATRLDAAAAALKAVTGKPR